MTDQLTPEEAQRLFDAVCGTATPSPDEQAATRAVYALLAGGEPVTPARLAAALDWDPARSHAMLERLPNTEHDEAGAIVGFGGLTLQPTGHRLTVNGQIRYAWCAWDTLFLPVALNTTIDVASDCPQTGRPVALTVTPAGIAERDPDTLVVSFLQPAAVDTTDLRASFCTAVHFLADPATADEWTAHNATRLVLDPDTAFDLSQRMIHHRCGPR